MRGRNSPPPRSPSRGPTNAHFTFDDAGTLSPTAARTASPTKESPLRPHTLAFGGKEAEGSIEARPGSDSPAGSPAGPEEESTTPEKASESKVAEAAGAAGAGTAARDAAEAEPSSATKKEVAGAAKPEARDAGLPPQPQTSTGTALDVPKFYLPGQGGRGRGRPIPDETLEHKLDLVIEVWRATSAGRPAESTPEKQTPPVSASSGAARAPTPPAGYEWCEGVCVKTADIDVGLRVEQFAAVAKTLCGFPSFFAAPLFRRIRKLFPDESKSEAEASKEAEGKSESKGDSESKGSERPYGEEDEGEIKLRTFFKFWRAEMQGYDHVDRFFRLVKQVGAPGIVKSDFLPYMEELLAFHPGLAFLESTPEFQEKYARTVIARIFYVLDPLNRGVITQRALRRSRLLDAFHTVDMEEDINLVNDYFSYEHFYVLYCKFWELDKDHDFLLSREDLTPLGGHALTNAILDRIFEQPGRPFEARDAQGRMGYEDFICLLLSEEDKTNEVSLAYWFRTIDLDGDGTIQTWEMRHFYDEQMQRMENLNCEVVPFEDVLCQMADLLQPKEDGIFRFEDFINPQRQRLTGVFFSVLFNLSKFTAFEQRDPFVVKQQQDPGFTAWDRYAQIEYARLALEEEAQEDDVSLEADDRGWGGDDDDSA